METTSEERCGSLAMENINQYIAVIKDKSLEKIVLEFLLENANVLRMLNISKSKNKSSRFLALLEELKSDFIKKESNKRKFLFWIYGPEYYFFRLSDRVKAKLCAEGLFFFTPYECEFAGFEGNNMRFYKDDLKNATLQTTSFRS